MRERFDFSSVSTIILENRKTESFTSAGYFRRVFDYALSQEKIKISEPMETDMRKIVKGQRKIPKEIANIYQDEKNFPYMKEDVALILEDIFDIPLVINRLYDLLMNDDTLSKEKRDAIASRKENPVYFVADCIHTGVSRGTPAKTNGNTKSNLVLADYLEGYHYPKPNKVFLGRDSELEKIHECLKTESCLFLKGIGGIGKSELAKHYGKRFEKEYDHILYLRYTENLYQTICQLVFIDDTPKMSEQERFESHYRLFRRLSENTLVILDNFSKLPEEDFLFQDFLSLSFRLLVTTRSTIDDFPCYPIKEIASMEALQEIFYAFAPAGRGKPDVIKDIIMEVYRHTLTVEMAAKTMNAADLTPEALLNALKSDRLYLSSTDKIRIQKDAKIRKATPKEHLARLFQIQHLSSYHQSTLQHLRLMPATGIQKRLFGKWMSVGDFNCINDLVDYGWVHEEEDTKRISIHPFLHEVLGIFDCPSLKKCSGFIENLGQEYVVNVEDEIYFRDLLNITKSIFKVIEVDDTVLTFQLFERVLTYLEKYVYHHTMSDMLDIMQKTLPLDKEHRTEKATYEFYRGIIAFWDSGWDISIQHFQDAITLLKPFEESNAELAIKLLEYLAFYYMTRNDMEHCLQCRETIDEIRKQYGVTDTTAHEMELLNQKLAEFMKEIENGNTPKNLTELLQTPQLESFFKEIKGSEKLSLSKEEFLSDLEKVEPEELFGFMKTPSQEIKRKLETFASSKQEQDEISLFDILGEAFNAAMNAIELKESESSDC